MIDEWMVEHIEHRPHPIVRAGDGRIVAEVQHEKDADLIAAAQEILEALEELEDCAIGLEADVDAGRDTECNAQDVRYACKKARAAISKAKGQLQVRKEEDK